MQYLQASDALTVKVVGELLSVKDSRAGEILKTLTDKGRLRKEGTARSTYLCEELKRPIGQVTVRSLQFNRPGRIEERKLLVAAGVLRSAGYE
jgi:hypothetical protein